MRCYQAQEALSAALVRGAAEIGGSPAALWITGPFGTIRNTVTKSTMTTSEAKKSFGDLLHEVALSKGRVVLMRRGKPVAAVVPIEDLEALEMVEEKFDREALKKARKSLAKYGAKPWAQVKKELGL